MVLSLISFYIKILSCNVVSLETNDRHFGIMFRVFAHGPGDLRLIPGQVIPKTQKMVLDAFLLNSAL